MIKILIDREWDNSKTSQDTFPIRIWLPLPFKAKFDYVVENCHTIEVVKIEMGEIGGKSASIHTGDFRLSSFLD